MELDNYGNNNLKRLIREACNNNKKKKQALRYETLRILSHWIPEFCILRERENEREDYSCRIFMKWKKAGLIYRSTV